MPYYTLMVYVCKILCNHINVSMTYMCVRMYIRTYVHVMVVTQVRVARKLFKGLSFNL